MFCGFLTGSELYGGLHGLGLTHLRPPDIHDIVRIIDQDRDGLLSFGEFRAAFDDPDADEDAAAAAKAAAADGNGGDGGNFALLSFAPKPMKELYDEYRKKEGGKKAHVNVPLGVIPKFKCKTHRHKEYARVWSSVGTASRTNATVWAAELETSFFRSNRARVPFGHFAAKGTGEPGSGEILEVTDTSASGLGGVSTSASKYIGAVLHRMMPHPARFHLVWEQRTGGNSTRGGGGGGGGAQPFFAWRAVPPSADFVALGMVGTATEGAPPRECMRCVPRAWVSESKVKPQLRWSDSGASGGRAGSLWSVTSLGLMAVSPSHAPPAGPFYELKKKRFFLTAQEWNKHGGVDDDGDENAP